MTARMENSPSQAADRNAHARYTLRPLIRLWRTFYGQYWRRLVLALLAMGVYALSASLIPAGVEAINTAFAGEASGPLFNPSDVALWGPLIIIALGLVNATAQFVQARLSASAALAALRDIQSAIARKLVTVDEAQARALGGGQLAALLVNDVAVLRETLTRAATAVRDAMTLTGLCIVMIWYDWALFLVVLIVYPLVGWPVTVIGKRLRRRSGDAQEKAGDIASYADDLVRGARTVRAFGLEGALQQKGAGLFEARRQALDGMARLRAANEPFVFFVGSIALAIVVGVVAWRIRAGALDVAQFISFIIALLLMSQPARGLSTLNAVAQEGLGALDRIFTALDLAPAVVDAPGAARSVEGAGDIVFERVDFDYDRTLASGSDEGAAARPAPALQQFSLTVPASQTVALVGASGSGKSTVFALLLRLYDPQAGHIRLGTTDIRMIEMQALRRHIALVDQETMLFRETIGENIARGKPGASRAEIEAAARAAGAYDFITANPDGFERHLHQGGLELSGGQRQRLAIARALLKDAPLLLLDEATSALDSKTEADIQMALDRLTAGRTTVVIAHRLATVRDADKIVLMDAGRIIDQGTHDELIARSPDYARLSALQFSERAS